MDGKVWRMGGSRAPVSLEAKPRNTKLHNHIADTHGRGRAQDAFPGSDHRRGLGPSQMVLTCVGHQLLVDREAFLRYETLMFRDTRDNSTDMMVSRYVGR